MTIKSRVEKLEEQILPPAWVLELERKLVDATIEQAEIERLFGYYAEIDQAGMNAICAMLTGKSEAELDRRLGNPATRQQEIDRLLLERWPDYRREQRL